MPDAPPLSASDFWLLAFVAVLFALALLVASFLRWFDRRDPGQARGKDLEALAENWGIYRIRGETDPELRNRVRNSVSRQIDSASRRREG